MNLKKNLSSIVLTGTLIFNGCSNTHRCVDNPQYEFIGEIDGEQIEFKRVEVIQGWGASYGNHLIVTKKDGSTLTYVDEACPGLEIEKVIIGCRRYTRTYTEEREAMEHCTTTI